MIPTLLLCRSTTSTCRTVGPNGNLLFHTFLLTATGPLVCMALSRAAGKASGACWTRAKTTGWSF